MNVDRSRKDAGAMIGSGAISASFLGAVPHFLPLAIFPLLVAAASYGGWWLVGPFAFLFANSLDPVFGIEERNMDPHQTNEGMLFWYKLSIWSWALLWPATLIFVLWHIYAEGSIVAWERCVLAVQLIMSAPLAYMVSHEFIHRRAAWERRVGEFLVASVSYPLYSTEHLYIHHARVCTPGDPESAPRGMSFWRFLANGLPKCIAASWKYERDRLARRQQRPWHITNPFWRYLFETSAWYVIGWWLGGLAGVLIFLAMGVSVFFQMRLSDYIQHYGLRRIKRPDGRFERVSPHHGWSAGYRLTNWLYFNAQRHPDHHAAAKRRYPVLQHYCDDAASQLPGTYGAMMGLALFPNRWFKAIDPIVDQHRARFYPDIDDWSAYDSNAFAKRPEALDAIAEILAAAPRLASWMNRMPSLLDNLLVKEFTDLDLPEGFGLDPETERIARRGLARVYWTRELDVDEMKEQIADIPAQDAKETAEVAREWCNSKVFQIGVHVIRNNLTPIEASTAISRVADASVAAVLASVCDDLADRRTSSPDYGICAVALGELAVGGRILSSDLDLMLLCDDECSEDIVKLGRQFQKALEMFSRDNLLFVRYSRKATGFSIRSFKDFLAHFKNSVSWDDFQELVPSRPLFVWGNSDIAERFDTARRDILARIPERDVPVSDLRTVPDQVAVEPGPDLFRHINGGLTDIECVARILQMKFGCEAPEILSVAAPSVFRLAGAHGLIPEYVGDRLAAAALLWRSLNNALCLVTDENFVPDEASVRVKSFISEAAGSEDFEALCREVRKTAKQATVDIGQIRSATGVGQGISA